MIFLECTEMTTARTKYYRLHVGYSLFKFLLGLIFGFLVAFLLIFHLIPSVSSSGTLPFQMISPPGRFFEQFRAGHKVPTCVVFILLD